MNAEIIAQAHYPGRDRGEAPVQPPKDLLSGFIIIALVAFTIWFFGKMPRNRDME